MKNVGIIGVRLFAFLMITWHYYSKIGNSINDIRGERIAITIFFGVVSLTYIVELLKEWVKADE